MKPIGVFDSGIGGLTVVKALRELLPNENIFYLGDTARVPYGNKSAETVERYALELAKMLIAENAKLIVVACNTVSSVAIPKLRANVSGSGHRRDRAGRERRHRDDAQSSRRCHWHARDHSQRRI
jgi:glutamate racemase